MDTQKISHISQSQKERLFHIDFRLRFLGSVNRNDLVKRFGIKEAAATRDLTLYRETAPDNLFYDTKAKTYLCTKSFKPVFSYCGSQALSALCHGIGDGHVAGITPLVLSESPTQLNFPNLDVLSQITRAIHTRRLLKIHYNSMSSGSTKREIAPFALVDNGLRWHVRAFDKKREKFIDFVLNRISNPEILDIEVSYDNSREADIQWNRIVEMHIVPHPRLKHPETIAMEYGMKDHNGIKMLKLNARAAVAGYVLRRWNVDCSKDHLLERPEIHLWLKNHQTLYGVENLAIAPGYDGEE